MIRLALLFIVATLSGAHATGGLISGFTPSGPHLTINLIFDQSALAGPSAMRTAVQTCATQMQNIIYSPLTVNIDVGWGGMGGSPTTADTIGVTNFASNYNTTPFNATYAQVKAALIANAKSANALAAVVTLPGSDPAGTGVYQLNPNQAYNYGLVSQPGAQTQWMGFATTVAWNYTSNPGPTEYDFIAACLHELSETLGRYSVYCTVSSIFSAIDLYRFSSNGVRGLSGGNTYFSINSGLTNLHSYQNSVCGAGGDAGDWAGSQSPISPFDINPTQGSAEPMQSFDLILLDILGWSSQ